MEINATNLLNTGYRKHMATQGFDYDEAYVKSVWTEDENPMKKYGISFEMYDFSKFRHYSSKEKHRFECRGFFQDHLGNSVQVVYMINEKSAGALERVESFFEEIYNKMGFKPHV